MEAQTTYELRAELRGHDEDVRGVIACEMGIVTASRDKTIKLWVEDSPSSLHCLTTYVGHSDYVGALEYIPLGGSPDLTSPALVSGSRDTKVIVWDAATATPIHTLLGHGYQVTGVGVLPTGEIVSTSLDKTVKVWKGAKCTRTLEGHSGPVLSLAILPTGGFVTGSGDTTIKHWMGGTCVHTYTGHTDTVRGLCALPGIGFVSASHDMTLKVWAVSGEVMAEMVGHTALVYACAAVTTGGATLVASGSEDNTARVWDASGQCLQVIEHVGCIWDVAFTAHADLVTACADGVARLWTTNAQRKAPADVAQAYARAVATVKEERAAAKVQEGQGGGSGGEGGGGLPPGIKVEEASSLMAPGDKDGAYKFVREAGGSVMAYAWSANTWQWEKVGEVMSEEEAKTSATRQVEPAKKMLRGKEYDWVFDVDVAEGAPPRKLGFNRGDNPYLAAHTFCEEEELPMHFRDQIVEFIVRNTEGGGGGPAVNDLPVTGGFCDPFTGGSTTQPTGPPPPMYRPSPQQSLADLPITGGFVDPFTGGGSGPGGYTPGRLVHAPQRTYLVFDALPAMDKLGAKVREFNSVLASQPDTAALALTEEESGTGLDALLRQLPSVPSTAQPVFPATAGGPHTALMAKLLHWPPAQLFPGLDVARLVALDEGGGTALVAGAGQLGQQGSGVLPTALRVAAAPDAPPANTQLGLRLACNLFKHAAPRAWAAANAGALLDAYAHAAASPNKAVRASFATLLSNISVALHQGAVGAAGEEVKLQALSCGVEMVGACPTADTDALSRTLTALATLLLVGTPSGASKGESGMVGLAKDLGLPDALRRVHDAPESRIAEGRRMLEAALDVTMLLQ